MTISSSKHSMLNKRDNGIQSQTHAMLTPEHLRQAVNRQIISAQQSDALLALASSDTVGGSAVADTDGEKTQDFGDENIRLIGGGNDLFVTIGIILLGAGLFFAVSTFLGEQPIVLSVALAIACWAVAEFVTRQHRMRLSSTVLSLMFTSAVTTAIALWVWQVYDLASIDQPLKVLGLRPVIGTAGLVFFGTIIAAALVYFWRFRVPILAGVVAVSLTALAFLFATLALYDGVTSGSVAIPALDDLPNVLRDALYVPLICGLVVFACGVALDLHDRERVTIWSDCAFWLHVVSAPLLVHPLFIMATGQNVIVGEIEPGLDATILLTLLIVVFVYVALAIDRRSLLIPTLAYFGTLGIYYLVNSAANTTGIPPFALILLVVGALIMVFGAGWQRIRRLIILPTVPTSVVNRLPPIRN
ncbi:MAG: hypothetical protein WA921_09325 [Ahrensia sp.]